MTDSPNPKKPQFRVVKVIDESTVVFNAGSAHGVKDSHDFIVYRVGEEIVDPISKASLGVLETVLGRAEVVHIQENMTTLRSTEVYPGKKRVIRKASPRQLNLLIGGFFTPETEEIEETPNRPKPFDGVVVGDFVKRVQ